MHKFVLTFGVGIFGGVCAVFVPRLGGMLGSQDLERIIMFPTPFIVMGFVYAAIVGAVVAILFHGKSSTLSDQFMAALGVPALLAGAISTSAGTNAHNTQVRSLQESTSRLSAEVARADNIKRSDSPVEVTEIVAPFSAPNEPGAQLERIFGIGTAYAQIPPAKLSADPSKKTAGWAPVVAGEPTYAIVLQRSGSAAEAQKAAASFKGRVPGAMAAKTGDSYGVIAGIKPESSAVLEAVRLKRELNLTPELVRVR